MDGEGTRDALRSIASLISKSEKAQTKLAPGTWQHTMLRDNIKALRIATVLMGDTADRGSFEPADLRDALRALASMVEKTRNATAKLQPGTSQRTLQRNRLEALRVAETIVRSELEA